MSAPSDRRPPVAAVVSWHIHAIGGIRDPAPDSSSHYCVSDGEGWQTTETPGFWVKPLLSDTRTGVRTLLMKVERGAVSKSHTHVGELEQIFMLEGSFNDGTRTLVSGDYCCRLPGVQHGGESVTGALMLLTYTPA